MKAVTASLLAALMLTAAPMAVAGSPQGICQAGGNLFLVPLPPDDPAEHTIDYKASSLLLTVDGRVVVDSTRTKLDCVYIDLTYFAAPIVYPEPSSYGSNAAIWMKGLGILLRPMSPGEHVIELQVLSPLAPYYGVDLGYYNTWYVTVARP